MRFSFSTAALILSSLAAAAPSLSSRQGGLTAASFTYSVDDCGDKGTATVSATASTGNSYSATFTAGSYSDVSGTGEQQCDSGGIICFNTVSSSQACVFYANTSVCFGYSVTEGASTCSTDGIEYTFSGSR